MQRDVLYCVFFIIYYMISPLFSFYDYAMFMYVPHYPKLKGSASIIQIVGLPGWDTKELEEIRFAVNQHKGSNNDDGNKTPLEVMNALQQQLHTRKLKVPPTPMMDVLEHRLGRRK
jgi:hypothetical protein